MIDEPNGQAGSAPGPAHEPTVLTVCLPVVIFTESDAHAVVAKCPIKLISGHDHTVAVTAYALPQQIMAGEAVMNVTHHVKKHLNGKEKIQGAWDVKVPIGRVVMDSGDKSRHICRVYLKPPKDAEPPREKVLVPPGLEPVPKGAILDASGAPR